VAVISAETAVASVPETKTPHLLSGCGERLKYPGLAVGMAVVAGPLEAAIPSVVVALCIARAALPTWQRTLNKLRTKKGVDADLLDSLWVLFHTVTGELFAPALAILLSEAGNTLRDATAMAGERRKPKLSRSRQYWTQL
jgi:hypothetical protein